MSNDEIQHHDQAQQRSETEEPACATADGTDTSTEQCTTEYAITIDEAEETNEFIEEFLASLFSHEVRSFKERYGTWINDEKSDNDEKLEAEFKRGYDGWIKNCNPAIDRRENEWQPSFKIEWIDHEWPAPTGVNWENIRSEQHGPKISEFTKTSEAVEQPATTASEPAAGRAPSGEYDARGSQSRGLTEPE